MIFGEVLGHLDDITDFISGIADDISGVFSDIDFSLLYSWLPNDITTVIALIITVLLFLALFGILRRILFFLG